MKNTLSQWIDTDLNTAIPTGELTAYLQTDKYRQLLKPGTAEGIGFVAGDLHILYRRH